MPEDNQSQSTQQPSKPATPATPPAQQSSEPLPPLTITQKPVVAIKSGDTPPNSTSKQNKK
jgi:hypothetical protein